MTSNAPDAQDLPDAPPVLAKLEAEAQRLGFGMSSDPVTGRLLRALSASKPHGALLELGTGLGLGTAWLLDGLPMSSRLVSIDHQAEQIEVVRQHLGHDLRLALHCQDAGSFMDDMVKQRFDLIFADARPGKLERAERALELLNVGGIYLVDDMRPTPDMRPALVEAKAQLRDLLLSHPQLAVSELDTGTGHILAVKTAAPPSRKGRAQRLKEGARLSRIV